jgi:hypothetical protein
MRSPDRLSLVLAFATCALVATACGDDGGASASGTGTGGAGGAAPAPNEYRFETSSYEVKAGEEINYYCFTTTIPDDAEMVVRKITPLYGKATHHLGVYTVLGNSEPEGAFVCPELTRETWIPLYGGGVESGSLELPEGSGFKLKAGQQVLVQLHLLNPTGNDVNDKATIVFETTDAPDVIPAGMYGMDNRDIRVPALGSNVEQSMTCAKAGRTMDVFAVFGHMHQAGKVIELSRGAVPGEEILYRNDAYNFDDQPTQPASFHIDENDQLHLRCWYDNATDMEMAYGESTFDEMCSFVLYHTPYEGLFGCLKEPAAP